MKKSSINGAVAPMTHNVENSTSLSANAAVKSASSTGANIDAGNNAAGGKQAKSKRSDVARMAPVNRTAQRRIRANCNEELFTDDNERGAGYKLIKGCLVPYSFLAFLEDHLEVNPIRYGVVLSPRSLFSKEMWFAFDDNERRVALPCVMYLVDIGNVKVTFPRHRGK